MELSELDNTPKSTTFIYHSSFPLLHSIDLHKSNHRNYSKCSEWLVPLDLKIWDPIAHGKQNKTLDIVTLFHKASSPASVRVAELLKQASAKASAGSSSSGSREQFELNITEDAPTEDQVRTILEYVGTSGIPNIVKGAQTEKDALKKFKESRENILRPLVCLNDTHAIVDVVC